MMKKSSFDRSSCDRTAKINIFFAFDSFRRQLECPGENHRHGKSEDEQNTTRRTAQLGISKNGKI